ncbi:hypothetical protein GA0115252_16955 [Streptomyces sp. DfronAA-171]|nr:hypothetical protein GA0115252_16955 [Streptomyces sp. DfronAA-171]
MASIAVIWPGQSRRLVRGARDSGSSFAETAKARSATGIGTRKIQRQDACARIVPETMPPSASAPMRHIAQKPMNLPRSRWSGTAWLMSASVVGSRAAAPSPERAWPVQSWPTECAVSEVAAPAAESRSPAR